MVTEQELLNFDPERFRSIQNGAIELGEPLRKSIDELLDNGSENLFFLGAGGAGQLMLPAAQLLKRTTSFPVHLVKPAEFMATGWHGFGERSIVVVPSLSGSTQESVQVLEYSKAHGAKVIALTGDAESAVARDADYNFTNFAEDDTSSESFYAQSLLLALALIDHVNGSRRFSAVLSELGNFAAALLDAKRAFEPQAEELARRLQNEPYHIITGAGSTWAEAWYYGTCILEEMQWIRTRPIHAADFFHGTLELVEQGVSVLIFKGEDEARGLSERVERFAATVTDKVTVLDTAEFELAGISSETRGLIGPAVLATILERFSAHLEVLRDHPLTTRRYYKRVEY
jgi:fructoselysine-6-phosphate deglycase